MYVYLGIDPGLEGAICVLKDDMSVEFFDLSRRAMVSALKEIKSKYTETRYCVIERPQSRFNMAHKAIKTSFTNYGKLTGTLECLEIPYREIDPQDWQKGLKLPSSKQKARHKEAIALVGLKLYPYAEVYTKDGRLLDGRSDALMIADWCRRNG